MYDKEITLSEIPSSVRNPNINSSDSLQGIRKDNLKYTMKAK